MDSRTTENGHGTKESVGEVECQGLDHANSALVLIAMGASSSSLHALRALGQRHRMGSLEREANHIRHAPRGHLTCARQVATTSAWAPPMAARLPPFAHLASPLRLTPPCFCFEREDADPDDETSRELAPKLWKST